MIFNKALIVAFLAAMGATANPVEGRGVGIQCAECETGHSGGGGGNGGNGGGNQGGGGGNSAVCPSGLYSSAQCCSTDVAGVADLDCQVPGQTPKNGKDFAQICAKSGAQPKCCVLGVAGIELLCQDAPGTN